MSSVESMGSAFDGQEEFTKEELEFIEPGEHNMNGEMEREDVNGGDEVLQNDG